MRTVYITAGAAGMFCGSCMHDNTLAAALTLRGSGTPFTVAKVTGGAEWLDRESGAWRPLLGHARYRLAGIRGLYLCGAGAHPGGGVTGGPGRNAAQAILADARRARRRSGRRRARGVRTPGRPRRRAGRRRCAAMRNTESPNR